MTSRRAYTLIELLIVVGVLGMAAAMLVPHLVNNDHMRAQAAVRQVIADLSFGQSDALAHQEFRRVHFYDDGRGYCIERVTQATYTVPFDPDTAEYIDDPLSSGGAYIRNFFADPRFEDVEITSVRIDGPAEGIGGGGDNLCYDTLGGTVMPGMLPGAGGIIQLRSGDDVFRILISPFTGKLTVVEL